MGVSSYIYNLTKKVRSRRLFRALWSIYDSEENVRQMYQKEIKEVIEEHKWESSDILIMAASELNFMVVQHSNGIDVYGSNDTYNYVLHDKNKNNFNIINLLELE